MQIFLVSYLTVKISINHTGIRLEKLFMHIVSLPMECL